MKAFKASRTGMLFSKPCMHGADVASGTTSVNGLLWFNISALVPAFFHRRYLPPPGPCAASLAAIALAASIALAAAPACAAFC
mmetsp:Transcript_28687/g.77340  ORF Transcript_28687/g.77340 Transcript_28687/m.77340 type:complete len:83 (-) Transcript_28687:666-914(-)